MRGALKYALFQGGTVSLAALRAAALAAQGIPADMASLPTISVSATTDAALTVNYTLTGPSNTDKYLAIGGALKNYGGNSAFRAATVTTGNIGGTDSQNAVSLEIETDSPTVEFRIFPQNESAARIRVKTGSGPWENATASAAPTTLNSSTSSSFLKVAFGSATLRRVRIELARTDGDTAAPAGIVTNIRLETGRSGTAPTDTTLKAAFYGDSISEASKAGFHHDGFTSLVSWLLGWLPTQASVGGTGYFTTGGNPNLQSRLDDLLFQSFDVIIVPAGTNDVGQTQATVTTAANVTFSGIRARYPTKPVFVIGPWDLEAPAAMSAPRVLVRDGIRAAVSGRAGFYWLDPTGVSFTKDGDAVHPTKAGHETLATWLNTQIRAVLGIA